MQNKKTLTVVVVSICLVGGAAFTAGRMISRGLNPLGMLDLAGDGISVVTDIIPAKELPNTPPDVEGLFVERQDKLIFVQGSGLNQDPKGVEVGSPEDLAGGSRMEVLITAETRIYKDTTDAPSERPASNENPPIQQTVTTGMLNDLIDSQAYVMIWGHRSGDRLVAETLVYSYLLPVKAP